MRMLSVIIPCGYVKDCALVSLGRIAPLCA